MSKEKKQKVTMHMFVMLFLVVVAATILTYLVPAGLYDRVADPETGRNIVDSASYHLIDSTPVSFIQLISSIEVGFEEVAGIICFTLVSGGAFAIIQKSGLIKAFIQFVSKTFKDKGAAALVVLFFCFATIDTCIGTPELCVVYIPIVLPLVIGLGYDTLTALGCVISGSCAGFTAGVLNPYTTVIAQKLTGLPLFSGSAFRIALFLVFGILACIRILIHAKKVKADPKSSITYEIDEMHRANIVVEEDMVLSGRQKIAAVWSIGCFVFMVYGIMNMGWDMPEMSGMLILLGIGCAVISGINVNIACEEFAKGASDVLSAALMIAIARAIAVVMSEGQILDTVVHAAASVVGNLPAVLLAIGIFVLATILNFFIPSGSGEATVVVPILSPLAQIVGVNQQTMILAFQFGDGFSNTIFPTNGSYLAAIQLTGVSFTKWLRYQWPLYVMWFVAGCIALFAAQAMNIGPF